MPSSCAEPRTCQAVAVIKMIISRDCVQGNGLDCSKQDFPFPSTPIYEKGVGRWCVSDNNIIILITNTTGKNVYDSLTFTTSTVPNII